MTGGFGAPTRPDYALTQQDVRPGVAFHTYKLGKEGSGRRGTFLGGNYVSHENGYSGDVVVDVRWHDGHETTELASELGLCPDRYTGEYGPGVTLLDEG